MSSQHTGTVNTYVSELAAPARHEQLMEFIRSGICRTNTPAQQYDLSSPVFRKRVRSPQYQYTKDCVFRRMCTFAYREIYLFRKLPLLIF